MKILLALIGLILVVSYVTAVECTTDITITCDNGDKIITSFCVDGNYVERNITCQSPIENTNEDCLDFGSCEPIGTNWLKIAAIVFGSFFILFMVWLWYKGRKKKEVEKSIIYFDK